MKRGGPDHPNSDRIRDRDCPDESPDHSSKCVCLRYDHSQLADLLMWTLDGVLGVPVGDVHPDMGVGSGFETLGLPGSEGVLRKEKRVGRKSRGYWREVLLVLRSGTGKKG